MRRYGFVLLVLLFSTALSAAPQSLAAERRVVLSVPGMTCSVCPITVHKALSKVPGVLEVTVDYDSRLAKVRIDPARVEVQALVSATAQAGYPSRVVSRGSGM